MRAGGRLEVLLCAVTGAPLAAVLPGLLVVVASIGVISPNATALALADHADVAGAASALMGLASYVVAGAVAPLVGLGGEGSATAMALVITVCAAGGLASALVAGRVSSAAGR